MWERLPTKCVQLVTGILQGYADKAVFRGFSASPAAKGKASFVLVWHHDRRFELFLDAPRKTLRFPALLPGVPAGSAMYRELKQFLEARQSGELPEHRRVDRARALLRCSNRAGIVSVTLKVLDGDFEYGARKLIHTVHEVFLVFLSDGPYYEYLVEEFGLDPDKY